MMFALLDTETVGLSPNASSVLEVAWALVLYTDGRLRLVSARSEVLRPPEEPDPLDLWHGNGLSSGILSRASCTLDRVVRDFDSSSREWNRGAGLLRVPTLAHNAIFDLLHLDAARLGTPMPTLPWDFRCSQHSIPWEELLPHVPRNGASPPTSRSLAALYRYVVKADPPSPHTALGDVLALYRLLECLPAFALNLVLDALVAPHSLQLARDWTSVTGRDWQALDDAARVPCLMSEGPVKVRLVTSDTPLQEGVVTLPRYRSA